MATTTPGFYVRINQRCWSDEQLNAISKGAQRGWFVLWSWSKDQEQNGLVTKLGRRLCDVTDEEFKELVDVGLLVECGDVWELKGWADWNMTTFEIEATRQQKSSAGKKGAAVKHGHEAVADCALIDLTNLAGLAAAEVAARIIAVWPAPSPHMNPESAKKIAEALQVVDADRWTSLLELLNKELAGYYEQRDTEPKARTYLASAGAKIRKHTEYLQAA